ncbi:MAG: sugar phosphate isomerase/epimerase [Planctomycetes bacterium]|nr:sugar phosphate isomerase/epimerase [Planctomycetota bacterium]
MRYAICNETFEGWEHARVCDFVAETGYTGLELAPFTLAPLITDVSAERRNEIRKQAESAGLSIIGLHWLLAKTQGYMITSPDFETRKRTGEYLVQLIRACRDFGGDILVLGSPMQRKIPEGYSRDQAEDFAVATLAQVIPELEKSQVYLCLEPLAPTEADFMQTAAEGLKIRDRLEHPRVQLHLDVKAMSSEIQPVPGVVRQFHTWMKHFHANDANKRGPGFGEVDFVPIFQALKDTQYPGWVSVEVFDYTPDPETIARESIRYMRECEARVV